MNTSNYYNEVRKIKLLTDEQEKQLFFKIEKYKHLKNKKVKNLEELDVEIKKVKNIIIEKNLKLVLKYANEYMKKYNTYGLTFDDLVQEGNIGLMNAIDNFDVTKGYKLSTYATPKIKRSIALAIDKKARIKRLPVHMCEKIRILNSIKNQILTNTGKEPTVEELASILKIDKKIINKIIINDQDLISLEQRLSDNDENNNLISLISNDTSVLPNDCITQKFMKNDVNHALNCLSEREKEIIKYHYGFNDTPKTLKEIANIYGITYQRVGQIESQAIKKLKNSSYKKKLKNYISE